jgi:hypothetical protein
MRKEKHVTRFAQFPLDDRSYLIMAFSLSLRSNWRLVPNVCVHMVNVC